VVRRAVEEDAPAVPRRRIDLVDLEAPGFAVRDPGAQVLARRAVLRGTELIARRASL